MGFHWADVRVAHGFNRSDMYLADDVLMGRLRKGSPYGPIRPDDVREASELSWARPIAMRVWLRVATEDGIYYLSGKGDNYEDVVEWLASRTRFDVRRSGDWKVNTLLYRMSVGGLFKRPASLIGIGNREDSRSPGDDPAYDRDAEGDDAAR